MRPPGGMCLIHDQYEPHRLVLFFFESFTLFYYYDNHFCEEEEEEEQVRQKKQTGKWPRIMTNTVQYFQGMPRRGNVKCCLTFAKRKNQKVSTSE
ncbi:Uncharacterized protein APZ42_016855 [Daphnia magna]|uniref:Uncharacterized protein n=1 Tax=Daphnia magna TaxID=35525 RepID=A0A165A6S1_9CRUS|nr:Uncharacterized protein APZ42_016855 [Daphnia magna]